MLFSGPKPAVSSTSHLPLHRSTCGLLLTGDPDHSFVHSTETVTGANNLSARMHSDF